MGGIQHPNLCALAREIWQWCEHRNIWLFASYISSGNNYEADIESRQTNQDSEWSLCHEAFWEVVRVFGQPDIDLFATHINKKCNYYISWHQDPGSLALDAFTVN